MIQDAIFIIDESKLDESGVPLALVQLTEKPFLEIWMRFLDQWAFSNLVVFAGKWMNQMRGIYSDRYGSINITYALSRRSFASPADLYEGSEILSGSRIMIIHPDRFFNVNLRRFTDFHQIKGAQATIAMRFAKEIGKDPLLKVDSDYCISGYADPASMPEEEYTDGGVFLLKTSLLADWRQEENELFGTEYIIGKTPGIKVCGFRCFSEYLSAANPDEMEKAKKVFEIYGY